MKYTKDYITTTLQRLFEYVPTSFELNGKAHTQT